MAVIIFFSSELPTQGVYIPYQRSKVSIFPSRLNWSKVFFFLSSEFYGGNSAQFAHITFYHRMEWFSGWRCEASSSKLPELLDTFNLRVLLDLKKLCVCRIAQTRLYCSVIRNVWVYFEMDRKNVPLKRKFKQTLIEGSHASYAFDL